MIIPTRGHILCEMLPRARKLSSGLWLTDRIKEEKNDNVVRCLGVGDPTIKTCYSCHDKRLCKKKCRDKGKVMPIIAKRTDIIHFKQNFGKRFTYKNKKLIMLTNEDIIAIERDNQLLAVGSIVIVKLIRQDKVGTIYLSDGAKVLEGDYYGEVISVGPDFLDKNLKKGDKLFYLRNEGYRFKSYEGDSMEEYLAVKSKWCYGKETI